MSGRTAKVAGDDARTGRIGHRGHGDPLVEEGRGSGRRSRSHWSRCRPTRSTPRSRHRWRERCCRDHRRRGRHRSRRRRAGQDRQREREPATEPKPRTRRKTEPEPEPAPEAQSRTRAARTRAPTKRSLSPSRSRSRPEEPRAHAAKKPRARRTRQPGHSDGPPYVTPLVRKLAAENNVDLAEVKGTGVGGRIRKQDVLAAGRQAEATPPPQRLRPRLRPRPPRPRRRRLHWRSSAAPRRRPAGYGRSPRRRPANPCRRQRN